MNCRTPFLIVLAMSLLAAPTSAQEPATTALDEELRAMIAVPTAAPEVPAIAPTTPALGVMGTDSATALALPPAADSTAGGHAALASGPIASSRLEAAADGAEKVAPAIDDELVGGQYIVISSSAILLALLIVLLAAD